MRENKKAHRGDGGQTLKLYLYYSKETPDKKVQTKARSRVLRLIYWPLKLDLELRSFVFTWLKGLYEQEGTSV